LGGGRPCAIFGRAHPGWSGRVLFPAFNKGSRKAAVAFDAYRQLRVDCHASGARD